MILFLLSKNQYDRAIQTGKLLQQLYPKCFLAENPKPLKKKIHKELSHLVTSHPELSFNSIKGYLAIYTGSKEYTKALQEGNAMRIDLDGKDTEMVTEEEREQAKQHPRRFKVVKKYKGKKDQSQNTSAKFNTPTQDKMRYSNMTGNNKVLSEDIGTAIKKTMHKI